ncbi:MAG: NUDIX domain-containing protein [Candidatus Roizmanbacteria bacterium]
MTFSFRFDSVLQVGVKALIKGEGDRYLFLKRSKVFSGESIQKWDIPGGRIKTGEPIYKALERELFEETHLRMKGTPQVIIAQDIFFDSVHVVRLTFIVSVENSPVILDPKEHSEYRWMMFEELKTYAYDQLFIPIIEKLTLC